MGCFLVKNNPIDQNQVMDTDSSEALVQKQYFIPHKPSDSHLPLTSDN